MFNKLHFNNINTLELQIRNTLRKKIYYWSPFLSPIATCKAVINSAHSLNLFGSNYEPFIFNFFGEFNNFQNIKKTEKIKFLNYYNLDFTKFLPKEGFIGSRFSFLIFFFFGFFPLRKILKKDKPNYLLIHLVTSLPLILLILFNFETKFILRISGYPRMNFLRRLLWKTAFKKIYLITCPTNNTLNYIKGLNLVDSSKLKLLYDPIIYVNEINKKKNEKIDLGNFFLSVGRLTKQKNFMFLCKAFKELIKKNKDIKLAIAGSGEEELNLKRFININNLQDNIILLGYVENIYPYFKNSRGFILSSLWEDPGFVLIEASFCKSIVFSSNAWPGPIELIKDNFNGVVFESNNLKNFLEKFKYFIKLENSSKIKLNSLKQSKKFTLFHHYKNLVKLF